MSNVSRCFCYSHIQPWSHFEKRRGKTVSSLFCLYRIKFSWHLVFGMYLVFSHPSIQWKEHQSTALSFHPKGWRYWQILKYLSANAKYRFLKSRGWSQKFATGLNVTIGVDEKIYEWPGCSFAKMTYSDLPNNWAANLVIF